MTDIVDVAADLADQHVARLVARVDPTIPAGVAGECEECGEIMPRLIGGRCGYCRDGRLHPFERARPERATVACSPPEKEQLAMPNPTGTKTVGFAASGAVLDEIERRVAGGESTSAVVRSLVEAGMAAPAAIAAPASALYPDLSAVSLMDILDELRRRAEDTARSEELEARAIAAETKLAAVTTLLTGAAA